MKRSFTIFLAVALMCIPTVGAEQLSVYTENNPPGSYILADKPAGMAVEIVNEILHRLGRPEKIEMVPWARGYNLALTRENVALFSTTRLPQRESRFHWVGPIYTQTWGFYALKGAALHIDSLEDAKKIGRIGTYRDDAKEQFLKQNAFTNMVSANRNIINVRRLLQGDIDLWVSSDLNVNYIVEQAGEDASRIELVYPFRNVENYIVFSIQTNRDIVDAWQKTLDAMKQDGTYQRIVTRTVR